MLFLKVRNCVGSPRSRYCGVRIGSCDQARGCCQPPGLATLGPLRLDTPTSPHCQVDLQPCSVCFTHQVSARFSSRRLGQEADAVAEPAATAHVTKAHFCAAGCSRANR